MLQLGPELVRLACWFARRLDQLLAFWLALVVLWLVPGLWLGSGWALAGLWLARAWLWWALVRPWLGIS